LVALHVAQRLRVEAVVGADPAQYFGVGDVLPGADLFQNGIHLKRKFKKVFLFGKFFYFCFDCSRCRKKVFFKLFIERKYARKPKNPRAFKRRTGFFFFSFSLSLFYLVFFSMVKALLRFCVRYLVLWLVLPNLLWHACWWWYKRERCVKNPAKEDTAPVRALLEERNKELGKERKTGRAEAKEHSKHNKRTHDAILLQEAVFQTSRTDFLASCAKASVDELRFRRDRILMFQKFVRRIKGAENVKQRLSLQLLAVENWLNLKSQERNDLQLYEYTGVSRGLPSGLPGGLGVESDRALFREYVKFKEEYQAQTQHRTHPHLR